MRIWLRFSKLQKELFSSLVSPESFFNANRGYCFTAPLSAQQAAHRAPHLQVYCLDQGRDTEGCVRVKFIYLGFVWWRKLSKHTHTHTHASPLRKRTAQFQQLENQPRRTQHSGGSFLSRNTFTMLGSILPGFPGLCLQALIFVT